MNYQTFPDAKGSSDSEKKLASLRLPNDMNEMSVLDLGCNEGFFSIEAARRGAARVVGIDINPAVIEAAKARATGFPVVEFRTGQMHELPDGQFDIIFLFSALHYIATPTLLFRILRTKLKPGGRLILEAGVSLSPGKTVVRALRSIDERFFPTLDLLTTEWLRGYSVRMYGESVRQNGDPMPRYVFHCVPETVSVVFVTGDGAIGKTSLLRHFSDAIIVSADNLFSPVRASEYKKHPAQDAYDKSLQKTKSIFYTWEAMENDPTVRQYFAHVIAAAILQAAPEVGVLVVEGFILKTLVVDIKAMLGERYRYWSISGDNALAVLD